MNITVEMLFCLFNYTIVSSKVKPVSPILHGILFVIVKYSAIFAPVSPKKQYGRKDMESGIYYALLSMVAAAVNDFVFKLFARKKRPQ